MTLSWSALTVMMEKGGLPFGYALSYEFRPSIPYHIEGYDVDPKYYELTKGEYWRKRDVILAEKHTKWNYQRSLNPSNFQWQRFTLTDVIDEKTTLILQMNSQGHVDQLKEELVTESRLVFTKVQ